MTKCKFDAIVLRDNQWITLDSSLLVPGDIIKITEDMKTFFCDLILLHGECVVDESMLTGESVPVSKSSILQNVVVDDSENSYVTLKKNNILFCGTNIMQTKPSKDGRVWAIVQSTGFNTTKGQLFRSIIHPQPHSFKLYIDSMKFVGVLGIFGNLLFSSILVYT